MMAYFLFLKLKRGLWSLKKPLTLVIFVLLAGALGFYGWIFATLGDKIVSGEIDVVTFGWFQNIFLGGLAVFTILRMIFPTYQPLKQFLPSTFPISKWKNFFLALAADFFNPYFFYTSVLLVSIILSSKEIPVSFYSAVFAVLFGAHMLRRIIQNWIEFKFSNKIYCISISLLVISSALFYLAITSTTSITWGYLLIFGLLLFANFQLESHRKERHLNISQEKKKRSWKYIKLIIQNPKARYPLIIGIVLKIILFGGDWFLFKTKGEHILDGSAMYWLFATPLVIFTYTFNNTWGFWKSIWLNIELRTGSFGQLIWNNLKLLAIPLLLDMLVTFPFLFITWNKPWFIVIFYFTNTIFLISTSFIWSTLTPRKIGSAFQMKGSTSPASIIVSMGSILLLTTIEISRWFYILIPFYLILSGFAIYLAQLFYSDWKHILVRKLR
jgi:hypothetical protein